MVFALFLCVCIAVRVCVCMCVFNLAVRVVIGLALFTGPVTAIHCMLAFSIEHVPLKGHYSYSLAA